MRTASGMLVVGLLFAGLCGGASAELILKWDQGYPAMDHGYDWVSQATIDQVPWAIVADDFYCEEGLPVAAVRWWGSHLPDYYQPDHFMIRFYTDKEGADPSQPDRLIYEHKCFDFQYEFIGYDKVGNPVFDYWQEIPWFEQEPDTYYWLAIIAVYDLPEGWAVWGWHESLTQWRDDAVQWYPALYGDDEWHELWNPQTEKSIDMAFQLWAVPEPGLVSLAGLLVGAGALWLRRK